MIRSSDGKVNAVRVIRAVLIAAAVSFIIIGILRGDLYDVFIKASKICMECIGIG